MAAPGSEKSSKKKTEKKLAAREEAKLLASFMGVMNAMRKQVREAPAGAGSPRGPYCPEGRSRGFPVPWARPRENPAEPAPPVPWASGAARRACRAPVCVRRPRVGAAGRRRRGSVFPCLGTPCGWSGRMRLWLMDGPVSPAGAFTEPVSDRTPWAVGRRCCWIFDQKLFSEQIDCVPCEQ